MASLIETLIDVLDKENTEYESLLELSKAKTTAIVSGQVEKLQEILVEEQKYIERINVLDDKREENVKDICDVLNLPFKDVKVDRVIQILENQPKERDALKKAQMQIKRTIDQLMKINENNKILLKESMDMIDFELNLAKNAIMAPKNANYSRGACEQNSIPGIAKFDAKQ
jgi:flagellar biosynthesis/type III secretory pathway chaperone